MNKTRAFLYALICFAASLGPAWFWNGGVIELEALSFITHYTADRPILRKVFDPEINDFGAYQARETSYLIDYGDAQFYSFVARTLDRTLFVPLSSFAASLLIVAVFLSGAKRTMPHLDAVPASLLLACLLTSFTFVSTMGVFYRSSKPMLTVVVLAFLFHVRHVQQKRSRRDDPPLTGAMTRDGVAAAGLCIGAGLLDRQGFFYVLVAATVLGLHYRLTRQLRDLLVGAGVAAVVLLLYNLVLAPSVIQSVNGYWPDFSYQSASLGSLSLLWHPQPFWSALELLVENIGGLLGGFRSAALVLSVWCVFGYLSIRGRWHDSGRRTLAYVGIVFVAQVIMFGLMIHQHAVIAEWGDHRYWYYPLPFMGTVLFGLAMWLDAAGRRLSRNQRRLVSLVLVALALSNVAGLERDGRIMTGGPWFGPVYAQSELLKASLRSGSLDPRLDREYREFFNYDRGRR